MVNIGFAGIRPTTLHIGPYMTEKGIAGMLSQSHAREWEKRFWQGDSLQYEYSKPNLSKGWPHRSQSSSISATSKGPMQLSVAAAGVILQASLSSTRATQTWNFWV